MTMIVATKRLDGAGTAAAVVAEGKLSGRDSCERLRRALLAAVGRHQSVVADLLAATEADAGAIGALAEAAAKAGLEGKTFAVAAVGEVAETIAKVGFAGALGLRESVEASEL
jgi:anti-anti-sigma regulatory factor